MCFLNEYILICAYINWRHKPRHDLADDTNNINDIKNPIMFYIGKIYYMERSKKVDDFHYSLIILYVKEMMKDNWTKWQSHVISTVPPSL